jgi:hypothetical protein
MAPSQVEKRLRPPNWPIRVASATQTFWAMSSASAADPTMRYARRWIMS